MKGLIVATAALLLTACATPPTTDQPDAEERTYITGSRLPVKDKTSSSTTTVTPGPPPPMPRGAGTPSRGMGGNRSRTPGLCDEDVPDRSVGLMEIWVTLTPREH